MLALTFPYPRVSAFRKSETRDFLLCALKLKFTPLVKLPRVAEYGESHSKPKYRHFINTPNLFVVLPHLNPLNTSLLTLARLRALDRSRSKGLLPKFTTPYNTRSLYKVLPYFYIRPRYSLCALRNFFFRFACLFYYLIRPINVSDHLCTNIRAF